MFTEQDLSELVAFRSDDSPVLSLYLNVDPTQVTSEQYKLKLRTMLKGVATEAHPDDIGAVERFFNFGFDRQGRGVAAFSCHGAGYWRHFSLAVPVADQAFVYHRPYIKPMTDVLDAYGRYAVLLVEQTGARMFLFNLGELVEAAGLIGEEVRRTKHGGASGVAGMRGGMTARTARREEATVQRNLKEIAEATAAFCSGSGCTRLVLGGTDANVNLFREMLPKPLQDTIIGSFSVDFGASIAEVQARSMEVIEEVAERREIELVGEMVAGWKRGSGATAGLSDTLVALQEHRPWILLISAGYEASGYRCQNCRYLMLGERDECPLCGGHVEPVEDLVDSMTHRALEQGIEVEIVRGNEQLESAGSIGALLRY